MQGRRGDGSRSLMCSIIQRHHHRHYCLSWKTSVHLQTHVFKFCSSWQLLLGCGPQLSKSRPAIERRSSCLMTSMRSWRKCFVSPHVTMRES